MGTKLPWLHQVACTCLQIRRNGLNPEEKTVRAH